MFYNKVDFRKFIVVILGQSRRVTKCFETEFRGGVQRRGGLQWQFLVISYKLHTRYSSVQAGIADCRTGLRTRSHPLGANRGKLSSCFSLPIKLLVNDRSESQTHHCFPLCPRVHPLCRVRSHPGQTFHNISNELAARGIFVGNSEAWLITLVGRVFDLFGWVFSPHKYNHCNKTRQLILCEGMPRSSCTKCYI